MYYRTWIERALDHIEANLTTPLDPAVIAQQAGFSLYHFHRIFRGAIGESMADYIRRRRLSEAAKALLCTSDRIIDVALTYQFESQASFTRAFCKAFGVTPNRYRRSGQPLLLLEKHRLAGPALDHRLTGVSLQPTVIDLPAMMVVGLPYRGQNQQGEIPGLWPVFQRRAAGIAQRREPGVTLGICEPAPHLTNDSEIHWLWGAEVQAQPESLPAGLVLRTLPASRYAVFVHSSGAQRLADTYRYIFGVWLPRSDVRQADSPDFERYDAREPGVIRIYLPIRTE